MTTWGDLEVGSRIIYDGGEYADMEHVVKVLKRGSLSVRAVLEPMVTGVEKVAKVAVRARLSDKVKLAEGAPEPDRPGTAITEVLGATEVATLELDEESDDFVCDRVGVTTVAAHLRILHGVELQGLTYDGEHELLRIHQELHEAPYHQPAVPHRHREA